jgi:hypothetical protein
MVILSENFGLTFEHISLEALHKGSLKPRLHPWQHLSEVPEPLLPLNALENARVEVALNDLHLMIDYFNALLDISAHTFIVFSLL